ncbi:MAG: AAA family ATPase [Clostridiaceae bacterium]
MEYINKAAYFPIENLTRMSDVKKVDTERILYGNKFLDYNLGGCRMGELVIWTGKRGSGKSTVLNYTLVDTIDQKTKCFIYSGELSNSKLKQWLDRQVAGERYIVTCKDELTGREDYVVQKDVEKIITEWYSDYLFCYGDDGINDDNTLLEIMEYAFKRYNVKRFVLDNLKTIKFNSNSDPYRNQGLFVSKLKSFAKQYNVHIDLVVHPRKTLNKELSDEDVGGSVDIIDLADNVIVITKITDELINSESDHSKKTKLEENNTILSIKKNREYGEGGKSYYKFSSKSKRIYGIGTIKTYEWEEKIKDRNFVLNSQFEHEEKQEECAF